MASVKQILYIVFELIIFVSVGLTSLLMRLFLTPFKRGFFKDDQSLMYPYGQSTISRTVLYSVGFVIPLLSILIIEILRMQVNKGSSQSVNYIEHTKWIKPCIKIGGLFLFGAACTHFLTNVSKYAIGRLRPHFFDVCKPDWSRVNSTSGYILADDICTGEDSQLIAEARLSFLSGHASMVMYFAVFLILYLSARRVASTIPLLQPLIQVVILGMAFFTCLSRISDYKHHWSDVLAGAILGSTIGVAAVNKAVIRHPLFLAKVSSDRGNPNIKMILDPERNSET